MTLRFHISIPNAAADWAEVVEPVGDYFQSQFVTTLAKKMPWSAEEFQIEDDEVGWFTQCVVGDARFALSLTTDGRAELSPPASIEWTLTADARLLGSTPRNSVRNTMFRTVFLGVPALAAVLGWYVGGTVPAIIGLVIGVPLGLVLAIAGTNFAFPPMKQGEPPDARKFYARVRKLVRAQPYPFLRERGAPDA